MTRRPRTRLDVSFTEFVPRSVHLTDVIQPRYDRYYAELEEVTDSAPSDDPEEKKAGVLEELGVQDETKWEDRTLTQALDKGARYRVEQDYPDFGLPDQDLFLAERRWHEHHIHPVKWAGPRKDPRNMKYVRAEEHYPITTWWRKRRRTLKRLVPVNQ